MPFNPNLPASNSPNASAEMRGQLTSLKALIDAVLTLTAAQVDGVSTVPPGTAAAVSLTVVGNTLHFSFGIPQGEPGQNGEVTTADMNTAIANAISGTSNNTNSVGTLDTAFSNDPASLADLEEVRGKLNEIILAARR